MGFNGKNLSKFFDEKQGNAKCKLCESKNENSENIRTGSLRNHLQRSHADDPQVLEKKRFY